MKKFYLFIFILMLLLILLIFYLLNSKTEMKVELFEVTHQKIKKPMYLNDHLEVLIKQESDLVQYLETYGVQISDYSIDWKKEFILITYPYEISSCTYNKGNKHNGLFPLDIIYRNISSSNVYVYKVSGREFVTWEAVGYNKKIQFE